MQSVSPELAAAIDARERAVSVRLSVDWDGDGHGAVDSLDDLSGKVATVNIDRSLTTDLPDAVRVVEGSSAASMRADLVKGDTSDERKHAAWYFSRSNASSPLAGKERLAREAYCDLVFQTSAGPQAVRRFTGRTRRLPVSAGNRSAQIEALDYREQLRGTVSLIPTNGAKQGADGTWVVTQALHACGVHAGPAPRSAGSMLWAPLYGSLATVIPRIDDQGSWLATFADAYAVGPDSNVIYRPAFTPGPFVLAADAYYNSAADFRRPFIQRPPADPSWNGNRGRWEQWVKGVASPAGFRRAAVTIGQGPLGPWKVVLGVQENGTLFLITDNPAGVTLHSYVSTATVPLDGAWHAVGIHWDYVAQQIVFKIDGTVQTVATAAIAGEVPAPQYITMTSTAPTSDMHIHDIPAATSWLADTTVVGAVIDPSLLQLDACYEAAPREAWAVLDEMAGAEQAVQGYDEQGLYRYRTRKRLVDTTGQTVQRTLTADASILDLDIDDGVDQVRNIIQVQATPVTVMTKRGPVYSDTQQRTIPGTTTTEIVISFSQPVLELSTLIDRLSAPGSFSYIVVTFNSDGTAEATASSLCTATLKSWTPTTARIAVTNLDARPMYITGIGMNGIAATVGTPIPVEVRNDLSVAQFGPQPLPLSASKWIQRFDVAQQLATVLLGELKDPRPVISHLGIIGDPRLQLGDRVRIKDLDGVVLDGEYWLTKIADSVSESGGYTQQLAARQASTVLRWGVGRWGVDVWGSG